MQLPDKALAATADPAVQSRWDKIVSMTPVVMTVIATILAGLSSSEMSIAQYHRALSAQNQSKAGDQWSFYQAKKLREATMESSLELMRGLGTSGALSVEGMNASVARLEHDAGANATSSPSTQATTAPALLQSPAAQLRALMSDPSRRQMVTMLLRGKLPHAEDKPVNPPEIQAVLTAVDRGEDETQTAPLTRKVSGNMLGEAFSAADSNSRAWDDLSKPMIQLSDTISSLLATEASAARQAQRAARDGATTAETREADRASAWRTDADELNADYTAAKLHWSALRYAADARYNFTSARLYEVQVRRSSADSERHRDRSKDFFYGMLAAQAAVTIATFSLALKQRSLLWSLATIAGLAAIGLGIYVYLFT